MLLSAVMEDDWSYFGCFGYCPLWCKTQPSWWYCFLTIATVINFFYEVSQDYDILTSFSLYFVLLIFSSLPGRWWCMSKIQWNLGIVDCTGQDLQMEWKAQGWCFLSDHCNLPAIFHYLFQIKKITWISRSLSLSLLMFSNSYIYTICSFIKVKPRILLYLLLVFIASNRIVAEFSKYLMHSKLVHRSDIFVKKNFKSPSVSSHKMYLNT